VWNGSQVIVWGGFDGAQPLDTGARYSPSGDAWTAVAPSGIAARRGHAAIWTGSQMIVWGGRNNVTAFSGGARYSSAVNVWSSMSSTGAPSARSDPAYVWTAEN
jgi:hypothetical protein